MEAKIRYDLARDAMRLAILGDVLGMSDMLDKHPEVANLKEEENGNIPLHVACSKGNLALVRLLIARGANIDSQDIFGNAPLHYACDKAQKDVVAYLISNKANLELSDNRGNSPLHHAAAADSMIVVNMLLRAGVTPDSGDFTGALPADKTRMPAIKAVIENTIKARKDGGESQGKESVNWMGFGIGLGVGIGLAMAQQQQAQLDEKIALMKARQKEDDM